MTVAHRHVPLHDLGMTSLLEHGAVRRFIEVFGWYGAAALLAAYALLTLGVITSGPGYQALNLTGALGVGTAALAKRSYQAAVLEYVWAAVALFALVRVMM